VKRLLAQVSAICAVTFALLCLQVDIGSADGWAHYHHYRHHAHVAYVEPDPYDGGWRIGWCQTLRYGHVKPRWGEWCR
jgi:hypothetical protein